MISLLIGQHAVDLLGHAAVEAAQAGLDVPVLLQGNVIDLGSYRLQVAEACSGQEALEACDRLHPDVVLMDIMMPDMNGYQVLSELKQSDTTKSHMTRCWRST